jgi:hypothetical protein
MWPRLLDLQSYFRQFPTAWQTAKALKQLLTTGTVGFRSVLQRFWFRRARDAGQGSGQGNRREAHQHHA